MSKDAPINCIGDERLRFEVGGEEVAPQFEPNSPQERAKQEGKAHGVGLGQFDVAPGGEHSTTPPLVREGLEMPSTLAT